MESRREYADRMTEVVNKVSELFRNENLDVEDAMLVLVSLFSFVVLSTGTDIEEAMKVLNKCMTEMKDIHDAQTKLQGDMSTETLQ